MSLEHSLSGHLSGAAALDAIALVRAGCIEHDGADPLDEAASLRLTHHGLDGIDAWVSNDGFALRRDSEIDIAVAPPARRAGLGRNLATRACTSDGPLTAWSHGDHPAAAAIAGKLGFRRARELWVMRRPTAIPLERVEPPAGVQIRAFTGDDTAALLAVNAGAFIDHPEQGSLDAAGFSERAAENWFDPAGVLLAVGDDGELLGFHWTKQHDETTGEVYVVGVSPGAQGRGLGRVLTVAGLAHLAGLGVKEVLLYVEADNAPAVSLYESLGFTHRASDTHVQYRRPAVSTP